MAIAFDAFSRYSSGNTTSTADFNWTHTPVGTPKGVIVFVFENNSAPNAWDGVTGVTYGGVAMSAISGSPNTQSTNPQARIYCYFLGENIPTGAQTVAVDKTANLNPTTACCYTVTAASPLTQIVDTDLTINSTGVSNPSATLSLGSVSSFCAEGIWSGVPITGGITQPSGWTNRFEVDLGAETCGSYSYDTIGTADVTMGWTQSSDFALAIGIAISECLYVDMSVGSCTLAGNGITSQIGAPIAIGTISMAGQSLATLLTTIMGVGTITVVGNDIAYGLGVTMGVGSISLNGNSIATAIATLMNTGVITMTGKSIAVVAPEISGTPEAWDRRRTVMSGNRR